MDIKPRQLEIIEAAGQLVTEDGFAALTTKRLAERMHFTEAALYRHFASKEEILVTMLHHLAANIDERLAAVAEAHPEPVERVRAMFDNQFTYFQKNPQYLMAIFATGVLEASHGIDAGIERIMVVKRRHLLNAIKDGQWSGVFTADHTAETLSHIIMGTFRLHMLQWRMSGRSFDVRKKGRALIGAALDLITR
ncbi:MAG: TetR/AcrR family transcriptional regulator [Flavobacteriales bacterium]|nr:TetR/AcrR family transcriptional regulator [Flavobacteriales bacterium]MCB0785798.1 TetR/AcrR family transcriptional regulator [Flavobacteriales bacterium]MCB0808520.1 TetR/AcrR family transcriptional regulator [Flavobacteriales bacterium]MCB0813767.1 TetR/AcrR family transcriptional regulator [Flavobacteriales bacterium]MCB0815944.1 TetR/AcrR family transcriptional regulator [Flavobacteriales bacterium]